MIIEPDDDRTRHLCIDYPRFARSGEALSDDKNHIRFDPFHVAGFPRSELEDRPLLRTLNLVLVSVACPGRGRSGGDAGLGCYILEFVQGPKGICYSASILESRTTDLMSHVDSHVLRYERDKDARTDLLRPKHTMDTQVTAHQFYPAGDTAYLQVTGDGDRQHLSFRRLSGQSGLHHQMLAHQLALVLQDPNESVRVLGEVAQPISEFLKVVDGDRQPSEDWCAIQLKITGRKAPSTTHRWHMDGPYFTAATGPLRSRFRYGCVLVGRPTVFLKTCSGDVLQQVQNTQMANRAEIKTTSGTYDPTAWSRITSRNLQLHDFIGDAPTVWAEHHGVALRWRADFTGDVHSEPLDESGRIFIAVLCGTKEEMAAYREKAEGVPAPVNRVLYN